MRIFHFALFVVSLVTALLPTCLYARGELKTGDLIFQDLACGELCDAIEAVTKEQLHVARPSLSHVGVVIRKGSKTFVLEAYGDVVALTPIGEVMARKQDSASSVIPLATIHWLPKGFQKRLQRAADRYVGRPYDDRFAIGDGTYYCSELVYEIFKQANGSREFFRLSPMTFGVRGSSARKVWERYFEQLKIPVPEGQLGLSPLGIWLEADAARRHR